jgi:DNA-binding transcriptional LysR family regulator
VPPGLSYRPSRTFERVVIAPKGHPLAKQGRLSLKVLAPHPLVMPWRQSATRQIVERAFDQAGLRCQVVLEAGGIEVIKRYVALGLGVGVVLDFCLTQADRKQLVVRPARHLFGQDRYGIVVRWGRQLSRASQTLIKAIDPQFSPKPSDG